MNNKDLVNKTSEFSGAKDLKDVYGDLFKYTESLEKRMPFRINLVRAAKAAITRSFEMVAETASSAGHADLRAYARLFKFNSSKHKIQLAKNFGSCRPDGVGFSSAKLEGKTFACYKRSTFPDFSKIMPKSKEFRPTKKSKPARIVVNFPQVKDEIINLLRSIAGSPEAPLDRNRLKEVTRSEARAIEYVIVEVTALIIAPIMAHEIDHHAFRQSLDSELFSPVDHEGADPVKYWNSFLDVSKASSVSKARIAATEHRAIDLMPDFNSALVASYGKDLEQALSRWPSDDIRQIRDVVFNIITKKHNGQSTSGRLQKDKVYNLPPGWENRYGHLMRNRDKQVSNKF
jgi:hypothetical protein